MKKQIHEIKALLPGTKENVSLKNYTTFKIGGRARYFFVATKKEDVIRAIKVAKKFNLPFFILGGGSNVLFSDNDFEGLVIKIQNKKIEIKNCDIFVGAGTPLALVAEKAKENNLSGLEWALGIPGTIGGAIYGNASAFGKAIGDLIKWVEVLDLKTFKIKKLTKKECRFKYKDSIFKHRNLVILSCLLKLKKGKREEIKKEMKEYLKIRRETQPLDFPSSGCIFKNLKKKIRDKKLLKKFPELEEFLKKGEVPAGYLIDKAGLKGKKIGDAMVSKKHANFIINLGKAKAEDVKKLINFIKKETKKVFGIELEEEIIIFPY